MNKTWNLEYYFYTSLSNENYLRDKVELKEHIDEFVGKYKGLLKTIKTDQEILSFLLDEEQLDKKISKVVNFVSMHYYLNSEDEIIQKEVMEVESLMDSFSESLLFVQEEIKLLGKEKLLEFSNSNLLKKYKNYFYQIALNLEYQLEPEVEKALLISSQSKNQVKLYEDLTSSYQFEFDSKTLSEEELLSKLELPDREIREKAYKTLFEFYNNSERRKTHASIYTSVVKDHISSMKLRGYKTPISMQNISEELTDESVLTMISTIKEYTHCYEQYLLLKRELLELDELKPWDVFAPIKKEEITISFDESLSTIYSVLKDFDEEVYSFSKEMIENHRVDVYPKQGKSQGAFALYAKGEQSFILLNQTDTLSSMYTLIHELGHAYHGHLSQKQPSQTFESPLVLAETASIFNELLLSNHLMKTLSQKDTIVQLVREIDEMTSNIFKQIQYVSFEQKVYSNMLAGEEFTANSYSSTWREIAQEFSGSSISYVGDATKDTSWQRIPHLYRSPFYCYSYAFGNLLSLSLYALYEQEGNEFISKYKNLLSQGGSKTPGDALKEFGLDIESKEFYELGLKILEEKITRLKELVKSN